MTTVPAAKTSSDPPPPFGLSFPLAVAVFSRNCPVVARVNRVMGFGLWVVGFVRVRVIE